VHPCLVRSLDIPPHTWLHRSPDGGWLLIHWDTGRLAFLDGDLRGPVHELTLPDWPPGRLGTWVLTVAPDRSAVAVVSYGGIAAYDASGRPVWRREHHIEATQLPCTPACHLDGDGRLWAYLPAGDPDLLVVHDARTGDEIARTALGSTVGGGSFVHHPDRPDALGLEVAMGQDGSISWWATVDGGRVDLRKADGECLTGTLPGGRYLAVPHDDLDDGITVRRWDDSAVLARRELDELTRHVTDEGGLIETGATIGPDHILLGVCDPEDPDEAEHHVLLAADTLETVAWLDYGTPMRMYSIAGAHGRRWLTQQGAGEPAHLWELSA
jgi:hypothetical protein